MSPRPFGGWPSPIDSAQVAHAALRLGQPRWDAGELYWLEARPEDAGRQRVVRLARGGGLEPVTPEGLDVRSQVHEYGGGDYGVRDGEVVHVVRGESGIFRSRGANRDPVPGTLPGAGYADFAWEPGGRWLVVVEEEPRESGEPANRLVAFDVEGGERRVVDGGHDFVSAPVFSPQGDRLAWLAWDHPNLPWDGTRLFVQAWGASGPAGDPRVVAGGVRESITQPGFSPDGVLTFVSDRSGWWNLYRVADAADAPVAPQDAEFGRPQWVLGGSTWGYCDASRLIAVARRGGLDRLLEIRVDGGGLRELTAAPAVVDDLVVSGDRIAFIGAGPDRAATVCEIELTTGRLTEHRRASDVGLDPARVSLPEPIEFVGAEEQTSYGFFYAPRHPQERGPEGDRPPLVVRCHGGPTAAASPVFDLGTQYWTSRGFALVDVDYAGSTGYGRAYRERLRGRWGEIDVEDCCRAARHLADTGRVDPERLVIRGGSAGGYTVLCALTFRDVFHAGCSRYGIGDLEALARDTHKFESRYLDGLVGPWPEARDVYRARSPLIHAEGLSCPVIFFQGLEDRVVPPAQAERMVDALRSRGIPTAYVPFAGEQHGFRRAENIRTAIDGELYFYSVVLGLPAPSAPAGVEIQGAATLGRA